MSKYREVVHSLTTKYGTTIWSKMLQGIRRFNLISPNDKIAVCLSGGKDSFILAVLLQMYQAYIDKSVEVKIIMMDPGYDKDNLQIVLDNIKTLDLDVHVFKTNIFEIVENTKSPCYGCAKKRRGALYDEAMKLGCNKIALGHHFNDIIETTLIAQFYTGKIETMVPKLKSTGHPGMELIRPLCLVEEDNIISAWNYNEMQFITCACVVTKKASCDSGESKRKVIKLLIKELKKDNPSIELNIFNCTSNIYLGKVMGYVDKSDNKISFLDEY